MKNVPQHLEYYWAQYLDTLDDPDAANGNYYDSIRIGSTPGDASEGARLILEGEKTATSALLWEFEESGDDLPVNGSLSIVEDGIWMPVCIVETVSVEIVPLSEVDGDFANAYSECDGTLEGWHRVFDEYYLEMCEESGRTMSSDEPLVCEYFRVLYP